MRPWRKKFLLAGFIFIAVIILFEVTAYLDMLEFLFPKVFCYFPIVLDLLASICFCIYTVSEPRGREKFGGNIVIGLVIISTGCLLAFAWLAMWHPEW